MFTKQLEHIITIEALKDAYKSINKKATGLDEVDFVSFEKNIKDIKELIIAKGLEKYLANKSFDNTAKINKQKNKYSKKFATIQTLHINQKGVMLGISKKYL